MEIQKLPKVANSHENTEVSRASNSLLPLWLLQCLCPVSVAEGADQTPSLLSPTPQTYVRHALKTLGVTCHTHGYFPHAVQVSVLNGADLCAVLFTLCVGVSIHQGTHHLPPVYVRVHTLKVTLDWSHSYMHMSTVSITCSTYFCMYESSVLQGYIVVHVAGDLQPLHSHTIYSPPCPSPFFPPLSSLVLPLLP